MVKTTFVLVPLLYVKWVEEIVDIKLDDNEKHYLQKVSDAVRLMNDALKSILE
jgi:hypothetical protein